MNLERIEPDLAPAIKFFSSIVKHLGPYSQQFSFNNPRYSLHPRVIHYTVKAL